MSSEDSARWPTSLFGGLHGVDGAAIAMTVLLLFIWGIPGTIALRTMLLVGLLAFVVARRHDIPLALSKDPSLRVLCIGFLLFSGWATLHTALLSQEPSWSLHELTGQHPRAWIALTIGTGLGCLFPTRAFALIRTTLLLCLVAHLIDFVLYWIQTGKIFLGLETNTGRLFGQKLLISYLANIYGALIVAETVALNGQRKLNGLNLWRQLAAIGFLVLMTYLIGARNGYVGLVFLTASGIALGLLTMRKRQLRHLMAGIIAAGGILAVLGMMTWHSDPRWGRFSESAAAALDAERSLAWLDNKHGLPVLKDGQPADHSTYMRVAGLRGSVQAALHFPLGYGFGRNAYSHAWQKLRGEGYGSSLSGLGDVLVSLGFPGLLLWTGLCLWLAALSLARFLRSCSQESLACAFLAVGFLGRSLVDSNIRDHSFELFMFLVAILTSASTTLLLAVTHATETQRANANET